MIITPEYIELINRTHREAVRLHGALEEKLSAFTGMAVKKDGSVTVKFSEILPARYIGNDSSWSILGGMRRGSGWGNKACVYAELRCDADADPRTNETPRIGYQAGFVFGYIDEEGMFEWNKEAKLEHLKQYEYSEVYQAWLAAEELRRQDARTLAPFPFIGHNDTFNT